MLIKALVSIEGSRKSQNPVINPNSVFEADDKTAKRLLDMGAAREATKEDIVLAKVHGLLIEAETKGEPDTGKAENKAPAKPKTEAKPDAKSDDPL